MDKGETLERFITELVRNDDHFAVNVLPTRFGETNKKKIVFFNQCANIDLIVTYNSKTYNICYGITDGATGTITDGRAGSPSVTTYEFNNTEEFDKIMEELLKSDFNDEDVYIHDMGESKPAGFQGIEVVYDHAPAIMMVILDSTKYSGNYVYSKMIGTIEDAKDVHTAIEKTLNPNDIFYRILNAKKKKG